jgi:hypothetical protein
MESIFEKLNDIKTTLSEIIKRLDEIETALGLIESKPINIQQDVEIQTAIKRLNQSLK